MWLFLLVFIAIYGAINFYFFRKIHAAYPGPEVFTALLAVFFIFAITAPILVRVFERRGCVRLAWLAAAVGYSWMAILFWFCVLALLGDGWNLGVSCMAHFKPAVAEELSLRPKPGLALYSILVLAAAGWGLIEAANIRLKEVRVSTPKLAPGAPPVRIVQITDIHLSPILKERTLAKIVALINEAKPDILVCTGDLSDIPYKVGKGLAEMLAAVKAPMGKFGCLGNHEYYTGLKSSLDFFQAAGLKTLRGESVVAGPVRIAGVDDPAGLQRKEPCFLDESVALAGADEARPVILLKHQPRIKPASAGRFDLQLSGHTHGGQIFPFGFVVSCFYPIRPGLRRVAPNGAMYVSRGAGTWGPPMRLFAPPEVTLILLEPE
jgi:predicted MPP superfamily phosphohydrolase